MFHIQASSIIAIIASVVLAPATLAQSGDHVSHDAVAPINTTCPIGKESVEPSAGTVEYKGKTIGLCCSDCKDQFLSWDEARKDEFVALATAHLEPGTEPGDHAFGVGAAAPWSDPYTLSTCPISGKRLGAMGDPAVKKYDGREVRFCCPACIEKFEADLGASWKMVDEAIVKDQLRYYASDTCVVSGEPLTENGEDIAVNMVYNNRLVRLCCNMCKSKLKADPKKFIEKLDKATADALRPNYPLATCPVSGEKLGAMGDPVEVVVAGRLMRLCCPMCKPKVLADPTKYIDILDKAWQAKGKYLPEDPEASHPDNQDGGGQNHGDHNHGG